MKICFLENTDFFYDSNDLHSAKLRGSETTLIYLSTELSKLGNKVTVINNCLKNKTINSIKWKNYNNYEENEFFDVAISNNDMRFFDKIRAKKKILISHSLQNFEKFLRKKQFLSYIKHKPVVATLGNYHKKKRNFFLRYFGTLDLDIGIKYNFLNTDHNFKKNNQAIFTSASYRNLDLLIKLWKNKIHFSLPSTKLLITPIKNIELNKNIFFRNISSTDILIRDLLQSNVFLIPGHKSELSCQAAEEAKELCILSVTLGLGSLSEQIEHEKSGLIAKNEDEFCNYVVKLFKDYVLYNKIKNYLINNRGKKNWSKIAYKFINKIKKI